MCTLSDKKTTTFDIMDDTPPLEKLEGKQVDTTKPVGPIMGRGMLWSREKRKEKPLKNSEGPAAKRARTMTSGLSEAKIMAKKNSADVINEFVDNIPDDGDEIHGVARINRLLLEIRALIRKHQVEKGLTSLPDFLFLPNSAQSNRFEVIKNYPLGNIFVNAQKSREYDIQDNSYCLLLFNKVDSCPEEEIFAPLSCTALLKNLTTY